MKKQKKHFIVSGCSFTETYSPFKSWSEWVVEDLYKTALTSKAMGSQGNGLISRSIIYEVTRKMDNGVQPEDMIVGVQWSGSDRMDFLVGDSQLASLNLDRTRGVFDTNPDTNWDGWMENPTGFISDQPKKWVISNLGWKLAKDYYMKWHSTQFGSVMTLEHILRTQWFLEKHNIKYFMTTMNSRVLLPDAGSGTDPTIKHLYDQIDFTKFLPVIGMQEWAYGPDYEFGIHPREEHHEKFAKEIVLPFVRETYEIS